MQFIWDNFHWEVFLSKIGLQEFFSFALSRAQWSKTVQNLVILTNLFSSMHTTFYSMVYSVLMWDWCCVCVFLSTWSISTGAAVCGGRWGIDCSLVKGYPGQKSSGTSHERVVSDYMSDSATQWLCPLSCPIFTGKVIFFLLTLEVLFPLLKQLQWVKRTKA